MLHAELHNKFDVAALDFERSEDILTSTVFGTLLIAKGRCRASSGTGFGRHGSLTVSRRWTCRQPRLNTASGPAWRTASLISPCDSMISYALSK